jgi:hypothetical protein
VGLSEIFVLFRVGAVPVVCWLPNYGFLAQGLGDKVALHLDISLDASPFAVLKFNRFVVRWLLNLDLLRAGLFGLIRIEIVVFEPLASIGRRWDARQGLLIIIVSVALALKRVPVRI